MHKILNLLFAILILIFFLNTYKYYVSKNNLKAKEFIRYNIDEIIKKKISELPILSNDTNNVIEFNNSLSETNNKDKLRSFWDLLRSK